MFSVKQKRDIADAVQQILRATNHPELPKGEIVFSLHVQGAEDWSWADIRNNGAVANPTVNPWNEMEAQRIAAPPGGTLELEEIQERIERDYAQVPWPDTGTRQADAVALLAEVKRLRAAAGVHPPQETKP